MRNNLHIVLDVVEMNEKITCTLFWMWQRQIPTYLYVGGGALNVGTPTEQPDDLEIVFRMKYIAIYQGLNGFWT